MGVIINGGMNIGNGRTLISSPYIAPPSPPITFNYELNYHPGFADGTISSISGATFTPPFTPSTGGDFVYTATGVAPSSPVTFGVYIGSHSVNIGQNRANLYKNTVLQQSILYDVTDYSLIFNSIPVSSNDNILVDIIFDN